MCEEQIMVNGKPKTKEDLEKLKEQVTKTKGMQLIEVSPNNYRIKLFG